MQKFLSKLFRRLMKSWSWVLLVLGTIAIKWVSLYPGWVENNYSRGIYPLISKLQRFLFGWIPFSIGDLFYGFLILVIIFRVFRFFKLLFTKKLNRAYFVLAMQQGIFIFLFVYVFFNLLWGLNYNRKGISDQLGLQVKPYTIEELHAVTSTIQERLNKLAVSVSDEQRDSIRKKRDLFKEATETYSLAAARFGFLNYHPASIKPSLFSYLGNYLGFQGYYNPFSGEGQVNTTIPRVLEPFVATHEIAHQVGYAKENEANFVAFLACRESNSNAIKYSMYFDMYNYAIREVGKRDTLMALTFNRQLHPQVRTDIKECRDFAARYKNPIEPIIMWAYGHYLKANNQPAGKLTYNEVVLWLVAYARKYGLEAL